MDVIEPAVGTSLDALAAQLENGGWASLLSQFTPQTGDVEIPRFSLTWGATLKPPLTALGMGIAFGPDADFSGIADDGIMVSDVTQQAFVDVNEQGTTAAAVTTVTATTTNTVAWSFLADHPFLFVIRERLSGAILFMGQFQRPPAA